MMQDFFVQTANGNLLERHPAIPSQERIPAYWLH